MTRIDRRFLLRGALAAVGGALLGACAPGTTLVQPAGPEVRAAEQARRPGRAREFVITARQGRVDLGGPVVDTWLYGERLPGTPVQVTAGERVRARLRNELPAETTVHWHGLALRNDADGVPGVTQPPVAAGAEHLYEFTAPHPGTYWFHPHHGTQLDRGLYAPLIVADPAEPLGYDHEWTIVLDDWMDGVTGTPDEVLAELSAMSGGEGGHGGHSMPAPGPSASPKWPHMMMNAESDLLGGDAGDVRYPHFLLNGRVPAAPETLTVTPGARVRLRVVNAGADTAFRLALGDHPLTVTHADGFPVTPVETDALLLGMGERYDVLVTVKDGAFPLVAEAEGKRGLARAILRSSPSAAPPDPEARPGESAARLLTYDQLEPLPAVRLAPRKPDRTLTLRLTGTMARYDWAINGRTYDPEVVEPISAGERVRLSFVNDSLMWHPMHLHGHTFALPGGARKDTAIVLPGKRLDVDFDTDNPGIWMIHCHNLYHAEAGMMSLIGYRR
ncbi:multicopper oxidase family protein [Nonomuraea sp. NPDC050310]|uniref:multicopper oxidase family protein n=1 Tax=Nonomuraea sp. NPDC050310 TaxID=3154935 RepID=UPI00340E7791